MTRYLKPALTLIAFFAVVGICSLASAQPAGAFDPAFEKAHGLGANFGFDRARRWSLHRPRRARRRHRPGPRGRQPRSKASRATPAPPNQVRGPMILGLALIESLVIYALIISLLLVLKVG